MELSRRGFLRGVSAVALTAAIPLPAIEAGELYGRSPAMLALPLVKLHNEYLRGLAQRIERTIIYGNPDADPLRFNGLAAVYNEAA